MRTGPCSNGPCGSSERQSLWSWFLNSAVFAILFGRTNTATANAVTFVTQTFRR